MRVSGCIKYRGRKRADGRRKGKKGGERMRALLSEAQQVYAFLPCGGVCRLCGKGWFRECGSVNVGRGACERRGRASGKSGINIITFLAKNARGENS